MEITVNFDALAKKANDSGGAMDDLNNVFGETLALEKWLFIARGSGNNIYPYIASSAAYADGKPMIRAFTDSDRLQRFARENNLTEPDGSALMLETPTAGIIEYMEQFVADGTHGVWFNSDINSEGYFIPIAQLRPIKEYLAKNGWKSAAEKNNSVRPASQNSATPQVSLTTVMIIIKDGLRLQSGLFKAASYACNFYCMVPQTWVENNELKAMYLDKFYSKFYGENWKTGNSDGSAYVVESAFSSIITPEVMEGYNWTEAFGWNFANNEKNHYWLFIVGQNGAINKATPEEFQQAYNLSRQITQAQNTTPAPPPPNMEDYGLSQTADGTVDVRIKVLKSGNIKFGTSLIPLYSAFAPLLYNYHGSGEFEKIINFAPEAMGDLKESVMSNTHGTYIRLRTFKYHTTAAIADTVTIDSNQLRHITTGATLLVSFALLNIASTASAALYFSFEGGKAEVEALLNSIAAELENAAFVEAENA